MATKLIRLGDGTLVEVQALPGEVEQIAGGRAAREVNATFEKIKPTLLQVCKPITEVWKELNQDVKMSSAEIEIGLSFAIEGDVYIAKAKSDANLKVKLILKPVEKIEHKTEE